MFLSYGALDERARWLAARLRQRFAAGDRLLLIYPPGPEQVVAVMGCLYAGMVAVPAPTPGTSQPNRRRVRAIARHADVAALLTDAASAPFDDHEVQPTGPGDADAVAVLQYTSGSTGDPNGVVITHRNILHNADTLRRVFEMGVHASVGGWNPLYHDMALMGQVLPVLLSGGMVMLMSPSVFLRRPYAWLKAIDTFDVSLSAAPNFAYELCCRRITDEEIAQLDLSRWRFAANGSEPVHASTLAAFAKRFAPTGFREDAFVPCYGLAEATVFVAGAPRRPVRAQRVDSELLEARLFRLADPAGPGRTVVSCGPPIDVDLCIVHPDSTVPLGEGHVGEIWLRGPSVAGGYWRNERATAAAFDARTADGRDGYLRTGDLGVLHEGELYVTGRIKEVLIIHGRNIYPQDIERALRAQHPELGCPELSGHGIY